MKQLTVVAALLVTVAAFPVFSSGTTEADASGEEQIMLRYYNLWPPDPADARSVVREALLEEFREAYPMVDLEVTSDAHDAWQTKVKTLMVSGDPPEVFISQPSDLAEYVDTGVYLDLTDALDADPEWRDSYVPGSLNAMTINGRVYGIAYEGYVEGVFYNQALFDEYGLAFPTSWDQLVEVVDAFAANDVIPFALAGVGGWPVTMVTHFLMDREVGYDYWARSEHEADATVDIPGYARAFDRLRSLAEMGAFSEAALGTEYSQATALFMQGRAAMHVDGSWSAGNYAASTNEEFAANVRFTNFPTIPGGEGVQDAICSGYGKSFAISSSVTDAQKEYAIELVKFLTSEDAARRLIEDAQYFSSTLVEEFDRSTVSPVLAEIIETLGASSQAWAAYGEYIVPGYYDEMNRIGQALVAGTIDGAQAAQELEQARRQYQLQ